MFLPFSALISCGKIIYPGAQSPNPLESSASPPEILLKTNKNVLSLTMHHTCLKTSLRLHLAVGRAQDGPRGLRRFRDDLRVRRPRRARRACRRSRVHGARSEMRDPGTGSYVDPHWATRPDSLGSSTSGMRIPPGSHIFTGRMVSGGTQNGQGQACRQVLTRGFSVATAYDAAYVCMVVGRHKDTLIDMWNG